MMVRDTLNLHFQILVFVPVLLRVCENDVSIKKSATRTRIKYKPSIMFSGTFQENFPFKISTDCVA